jgi:hypothetical protein
VSHQYTVSAGGQLPSVCHSPAHIDIVSH